MTEDLKNDIIQELESWNELKDKVLNVIPVKDISFRTRSLLSDILDRLGLSIQDRLDLEKYIIYGGEENVNYLKLTIQNLINQVPELNYLIDNIQKVTHSLNKLDELFKGSDESLNSFKELYNTLNLLQQSINNLNNTHNNDIKNINFNLTNINKIIDNLSKKESPFENGDADNSAVLKGGNNKAINANEVALGKYNKSNSDTCFSVGIGTSDNRKNAVEVKQNGDVYITGIGGYNGTNPNTSKSVQEVINELVNKLNEITTND